MVAKNCHIHKIQIEILQWIMEQRDLNWPVTRDCVMDYSRLIVELKCPTFKT